MGFYSSGKCASVQTGGPGEICSIISGGTIYIPEAYLGPKTFYSRCLKSGVCLSNTTIPAGTGANGSDIHAFITVKNAAQCSSTIGEGAVAFSITCQTDQCD